MPKTIQLRDETYARLRAYKVGGMTFDDVIRRLMEEKAADAFHAEYREWQTRVLRAAERSPDWDEV